MPLHLLGKKSWNVYNADNIARVKADEAAAAAREAAAEQRMQEIDAARRAAILRGITPPPLPDDVNPPEENTTRVDRRDGRDRKRMKRAGEDDTDRDLRLAASNRGGNGEGSEGRLMKMRMPASDAPLTDHAGNINLFPVDVKERMKREKNEEAEKEKQKKNRALEDQYTMRLSNAAGRGGLELQPWYASGNRKSADGHQSDEKAAPFPGLENKDVWGNEDPLRKAREQSRITSNDPLVFMQQAQVQLKKSQDAKKKWAEERQRELRELRATQERESRRDRHGKRKKRADDGQDGNLDHGVHDKGRSSSHRHRHRSRSHGRERRHEPSSSHQHRERKRSRSRSRDRDGNRPGRERRHEPSSSHQHRERKRSRSRSRDRDGNRSGRERRHEPSSSLQHGERKRSRSRSRDRDGNRPGRSSSRQH